MRLQIKRGGLDDVASGLRRTDAAAPANGWGCWHTGSRGGARSCFLDRNLGWHLGGCLARRLDYEGALRRRAELPPPHHDDHRGGRGEQHPRAREPSEIAEREKECALAAVEI